MNKMTLKSIWAILAGFILVVILSIFTDIILISIGIMKQPFDKNPTSFIWDVVLYRCVYGIIASYLTAKLAPFKPMLHSMAGGGFGMVLGIVGAIVMWNKPPHWYPVTLIITTLPCAWLGGRLFIKKVNRK